MIIVKTTMQIGEKVIYYHIFLIVVLILAFALISCDSSSGRANSIDLITFRGKAYFTLPIKVIKTQNDPYMIKPFTSKMNMSQIYDSINNDINYEAKLIDDYILIHDISESKKGYCIVKPYSYGKYNYIAYNMEQTLPDSNYTSIIVPYHLISIQVPVNNSIINEDEQYPFLSTKEDLIAFYEEYDYNVTDLGNSIKIQETKQISIGGLVFSEYEIIFEIQIKGAIVTFRLMSEN